MRRGFDHSTKRLKVAAAGHYTERSQLYNTEDIWKEKTQCPRQEGKTSASRCVQQGISVRLELFPQVIPVWPDSQSLALSPQPPCTFVSLSGWPVRIYSVTHVPNLFSP